MRLELEKITFCWDFLTRVIVRAITGASSPAVLFLSLPEMQWVVGLTSRHTKIDFSYPPCFKVSESCIFIMLFFVFFCLFLFQFKKSPPKIPYKAIALATVLFLIGAFLIIIGSLLLAGYISKGVSWGACGISRRCLKCQPLCCLISSTAYFSRKKKRWFWGFF